jgi:hypothetical protein
MDETNTAKSILDSESSTAIKLGYDTTTDGWFEGVIDGIRDICCGKLDG